jgi:hypothetical protein
MPLAAVRLLEVVYVLYTPSTITCRSFSKYKY